MIERKVDEIQFILQSREGDGSQNTTVGEPVLHYQSKASSARRLRTRQLILISERGFTVLRLM